MPLELSFVFLWLDLSKHGKNRLLIPKMPWCYLAGCTCFMLDQSILSNDSQWLDKGNVPSRLTCHLSRDISAVESLSWTLAIPLQRSWGFPKVKQRQKSLHHSLYILSFRNMYFNILTIIDCEKKIIKVKVNEIFYVFVWKPVPYVL